MFGLKSLRKAVADAEMWRSKFEEADDGWADALELARDCLDELAALRAELARWKPDRDMRGRFTHATAVMPEIAGRDCSFIERDGGND